MNWQHRDNTSFMVTDDIYSGGTMSNVTMFGLIILNCFTFYKCYVLGDVNTFFYSLLNHQHSMNTAVHTKGIPNVFDWFIQIKIFGLPLQCLQNVLKRLNIVLTTYRPIKLRKFINFFFISISIYCLISCKFGNHLRIFFFF